VKLRTKPSNTHSKIKDLYASIEEKITETQEFNQELLAVVDKIHKNECLILVGDFNARFRGQAADKYTGSEREKTVNKTGGHLIVFCLFNKSKIKEHIKHKNI
jgi:endonuclease/exonuclease/phosphatase (EEP) superfamily protein YafD